jgi:hypothetical protein
MLSFSIECLISGSLILGLRVHLQESARLIAIAPPEKRTHCDRDE